ncbi:phytoene/squalene synthase family protein [Levilinea saccharolytica]|uniref:phytoene/squalene synthase family protein n=1 Tax=Levilinea saccharolytica TaxID=229921 RepID=UPI00078352D2|nr:squalene/phytoene synthase family protein [Levilinea saccharolytica]GAP16778.1 phytoene/squalene synthetase [Levilinea saccharolytica]
MSLLTQASPISAAAWKNAQQATEAVIRQHSRTFHFATGLLPSAARGAIRALYAFCRMTDDLVDRDGATQEDLDAWRAQVNLPAAEQKMPVLLYWSGVRERFGVDRRYEQELIDGVNMDLRCRRYATWDELEDYCYHVASTVGLLSMPIIGMAPGFQFEQAKPYAVRLGVALQLTNILRDVGEDAGRGRVYFPEDDLARFGLTRQDILTGVQDERFRDLMRFEIARARQLYEESLPGIAMLSRAARPAVGAAALLYRAILDEIEAIDYQVYTRRAHTTGWQKLKMLPGIVLAVLRVRPPAA